MKQSNLLPIERIENKIYLIRGKKVMFDRDLAELYGVETKNLNKAVRRNKDRFPADFMFQLNNQEVKAWSSRFQFGTLNGNLRFQFGTSSSRSQIVTLKRGQNVKYQPIVFTEQGVAMLSSVLNSKRSIQVNIQIMRTFTQLREMLASNKELREKVERLERKYNQQFRVVFDAIKNLLSPLSDEKPRTEIGFK
jgi:phage regulator Rha-like protein